MELRGEDPIPAGKTRGFQGFHCDLTAGGDLPRLGAGRQSWKSPGETGTQSGSKGGLQRRRDNKGEPIAAGRD